MTEEPNYTQLQSFIGRCRALVQAEIDLLTDWDAKGDLGQRSWCRTVRAREQQNSLDPIDDLLSQLALLSGTAGAVKHAPSPFYAGSLSIDQQDLSRRTNWNVVDLNVVQFAAAMADSEKAASDAAQIASSAYHECVA